MIVFAIIGWMALILVAIYVLVAGCGLSWASLGFTGRLGWGGPVVILVGLGLFALAIWQAPFSISFSVGGSN